MPETTPTERAAGTGLSLYFFLLLKGYSWVSLIFFSLISLTVFVVVVVFVRVESTGSVHRQLTFPRLHAIDRWVGRQMLFRHIAVWLTTMGCSLSPLFFWFFLTLQPKLNFSSLWSDKEKKRHNCRGDERRVSTGATHTRRSRWSQSS